MIWRLLEARGGPHDIQRLAQIKLLPEPGLPMMLRGPRRFSFLELRFGIPLSLLVLAPVVHGALHDDFKLRNKHL